MTLDDLRPAQRQVRKTVGSAWTVRLEFSRSGSSVAPSDVTPVLLAGETTAETLGWVYDGDAVVITLTEAQSTALGDGGWDLHISAVVDGSVVDVLAGLFVQYPKGDPRANTPSTTTTSVNLVDGSTVEVTLVGGNSGGGGGGTAATTVESETTLDGSASVVGTSTSFARADHTHGTPPMPSAGDVGADAVGSAASVQSNLDDHEADTTTVHGIDDTSALLDTGDIGSTVQAHSSVLDNTTASYTTAEETKLSGIETGAEANDVDSVNTQTGAVVLDADDIDDTATTNKFATGAQLTKLDGVETGATADQTGAEIKVAYEAEPDTNAFTDSEQTKLSGVETGADVTDTAAVTAAGAAMTANNLSDVTASTARTNLDVSSTGEVTAEIDGDVATHAALTATHGTTGAIVGTSDTQTLTNKTITAVDNDVEADALHVEVRNTSGSLIPKGSVVYASGYNTGAEIIEVELADASVLSTMPALGVVLSDIANGSNGVVARSGRIADVDTSAWSVTDLLWVSETTGELTSTQPTAAALVQPIATVLRVHASFGVLAVNDRGVTDVTQAELDAHLNDATDAHDASAISVADAGGHYTGTDVEAVLQELPAQFAPKESTLNAQTGTTYTLVLTDSTKLVTLDNASAIALTVPTNASVPLPIGSRVDILQKGAGQVTVAGDTGVTVQTAETLKLRAQWSAGSLIKLDTDEWLLVGDLEAA